MHFVDVYVSLDATIKADLSSMVALVTLHVHYRASATINMTNVATITNPPPSNSHSL